MNAMRPLLLSLLCIAWVPLAADPPEKPLVPRPPAAKGSARLSAETTVDSIVIKFHEGTRVRLRGKSFAVLARSAREDRELEKHGLQAAQVENDVRAVQSLLAANGRFRGLERHFSLDENVLAARRASGEARSGRELADLDLYFRVRIPEGTKHGDVETLLDSLNAIASVEVAYAPPPAEVPADKPPLTPDFEPYQDYLGPAPNGIDAYHAWSYPGGRGDGTRIVDVEFAWRTTHEDMPVLFHQGGMQSPSVSNRSHGTAVLGVMAAPDNGYGVTGIVNQADVGYESAYSQSVASAITNAAYAAGAGGVILIELHTAGPSTPASSCNCSGSQCDFVPMEYWQDNFDAIAAATAYGTIVVEAGGNGATNLDDPVYEGRFNRWVRDSGAILVGASESNARTPACFTNYGSRVDMHGWGWNVATLGYGQLFNPNGDEDQWYTSSFSGTSSASPIVTGAAAAVVGVSLADFQDYGYRTPFEIRQILADTGTPQACCDNRNIGPLPNLRPALRRVLDRRPEASFWIECAGLVCTADAGNSSDDNGIIGYEWDWGDNSPSSEGPSASHTYGAQGEYDVTLTVYDDEWQSGSTKERVFVTPNPPTTPGNFLATANTTASVTLTWSASSGSRGIKRYVIQRRSSRTANWDPERWTTATSFTDSSVAPLTTYQYRVRAMDNGGFRSASAFDYATTIVFGPDLQRNVSSIQGSHIRHLRDAVDAWRAFALLLDLYPSNSGGTGLIKSAHFVTDFSSDPFHGVFTGLNQARSEIGLPPFVYSGVPNPSANGPLYLEHVQQLRDVMR